MKKIVYFALLVLLVGSNVVSCKKKEVVSQVATVAENAVWVTPTGKVIPYAERANWKEYVRNNFSNEKIDARRYGSQECSTATIKCGLKCVAKVGNDCSRASACAPCTNCGCTPVGSPY